MAGKEEEKGGKGEGKRSLHLIESTHQVLPQRSRKKKIKRDRGLRNGEDEEVGETRDGCAVDEEGWGDGHRLKWWEGEKEPDVGFEYLDHTADVQLHAWGGCLKEAFEQVALCMFNYMTPLKGIVAKKKKTFSVKGDDMDSLMYHWLDELLFAFSTELFVACRIRIVEFNLEEWRIEAECVGDTFDRTCHTCGTEIKAITYSAMQIYDNKDGRSEVYVIVDI